ncbi:arginine decarboxylase [Ectothiorhodospira haloalkaliphila]|uniref:Biosynthetic arginine decarboxylase n=1 Tax=Ectothiorhodospira haloalkaliphila TaxID=421628 RepID=W8L291_9GAMM|nr:MULTISPECIES: biosynthetic arginine decarboxylase [Ectothiorhodospira]AHK78070.1 arginine decarboxylase [Ectothiorhodospira haloalkaliphila]MCG5494354.1 biosynthetic arginine decarboxylase [Ectothiorhodospira variabilis]MCG5496518.1 biosynthetic arginine decarboxylase [Ectothiorhodospira variabilis]MCG5504121.1 biosynthetic arginine decarboxylase [Ectothiorhodospira variabilis]MCG5507276.1 biosynthetic arginine decarboxylase [Ectothiorhodospira variabilis]
MTDWTTESARQTYNIDHWNGGYFHINDQGRVVVRPPAHAGHPGVDLYDLVARVKPMNIDVPVLVRFPDILTDRVERLTQAFRQAFEESEYPGRYTAVYPIKVNQQRSVVERILTYGVDKVGLEAGSKPELMAVLALSRPGGVIVCNGYKDREYLRLAMIGQMLGHRVYIVIEKPSELKGVIAAARDLGVKPCLGMRVRLASVGKGKWQNTGGEKAKFGLSSAQALHLLEQLRAHDMLDCMQLLHFHMGSQIANIRDIQAGMFEASRFFAELHRLGAPIQVVDVGGGLGVDYEGTRSRNLCSINYSLQDYASSVVRILANTCREYDLPHPEIFTESGRATTAHHAVLITDVIDTERPPVAADIQPPDEDAPAVLLDMWRLFEQADDNAPTEVFHNMLDWLGEVRSMFTHGLLDLEHRALAEQIYFATCRRLLATRADRLPRDIGDELNEKLSDKYFCNFSVFQSIPDAWAIDQIFPIMPLHRLDERPTRRAVLQDLTCDSDGHVDRYVDGETTAPSLPLHELREHEHYLLGIFMVGAYQEILGDLHNLFGDTDAINVVLKDDGGYEVVEPEQGDTVAELLRYVHYDTELLAGAYRQKVVDSGLDRARQEQILGELDHGLSGYTYLEE